MAARGFFQPILGVLSGTPPVLDAGDAFYSMAGQVGRNVLREPRIPFQPVVHPVPLPDRESRPLARTEQAGYEKRGTGGYIVVAAGVRIFWSSFGPAVNILTMITNVIGIGFGLALGFEIIALVISLPLVVVFAHRH